MGTDEIDSTFDDGESIIEFLDMKSAKRPLKKRQDADVDDTEEEKQKKIE